MPLEDQFRHFAIVMLMLTLISDLSLRVVLMIIFACLSCMQSGNKKTYFIKFFFIAVYIISIYRPFYHFEKGRAIVISQTEQTLKIRHYTDLYCVKTNEYYAPGTVLDIQGSVISPIFGQSNRMVGCLDNAEIEPLKIPYKLKLMFHQQLADSSLTYIRSWLFTSELEQQSSLFQLISYFSLHIHGLLILLGSCIRLFTSERKTLVIQCMLLCYLLYLFDYQFSIFRILVYTLIKLLVRNRRLRFSIYMMILLLIVPSGLGDRGFSVPIIFQLISFMKADKHTRTFVQTLFIFYAFSHFNLLEQFIRKRSRTILGFILGCIIFGFKYTPVLETCNKFLERINSMHSNLFHAFTLRGKLSILVFLCLAAIHMYFTHRFPKSKWGCYLLILIVPVYYWWYPVVTVTFIDVGQGDAIVLKSHCETILIDTGHASQYYKLKTGLFNLGIKTIDKLIITHPDDDHNGNATRLVSDFKVIETIDRKEQVIETADFKLNGLLDHVHYEQANQNSRVLYFTVFGVSFLLTGDITSEEEHTLIKNYPGLQADVLKLAHHGSKTSSTLEFLTQIQAQYAIASAQASQYNHPHDSVKRNLTLVKTKLLTTEIHGSITFTFYNKIKFLTTTSQEFDIINTR